MNSATIIIFLETYSALLSVGYISQNRARRSWKNRVKKSTSERKETAIVQDARAVHSSDIFDAILSR